MAQSSTPSNNGEAKPTSPNPPPEAREQAMAIHEHLNRAGYHRFLLSRSTTTEGRERHHSKIRSEKIAARLLWQEMIEAWGEENLKTWGPLMETTAFEFPANTRPTPSPTS